MRSIMRRMRRIVVYQEYRLDKIGKKRGIENGKKHD